MKTYLIGMDIAQSGSPSLHRGWIEKHGLTASYDLIDTEKFADAYHAIRHDALGANITSPYKEKAVAFCHELSDLAKEVGAVNTIVFEDRRAVGHNTDVEGFVRGFGTFSLGRVENALVLGSGGAAKAVLHALTPYQDMRIVLSGRNHFKARDMAYNMMMEYVDWEDCDRDLMPYDLIVNATGSRELEFDLTHTNALVYDLLYGEDSAMIAAAKKQGLRTINGEEMLKHQAALSFELWHGFKPI